MTTTEPLKIYDPAEKCPKCGGDFAWAWQKPIAETKYLFEEKDREHIPGDFLHGRCRVCHFAIQRAPLDSAEAIDPDTADPPEYKHVPFDVSGASAAVLLELAYVRDTHGPRRREGRAANQSIAYIVERMAKPAPPLARLTTADGVPIVEGMIVFDTGSGDPISEYLATRPALVGVVPRRSGRADGMRPEYLRDPAYLYSTREAAKKALEGKS